MPVRYPRAWLVIDGFSIPIIEGDVTTHRYQSSDTFTATIALDAPSVPGEAYWAGKASIKAEFWGTNGDGSDAGVALLKGQVDQVQIDFAARTVHASGRDRTAELLDKTTTEKFQDQKPSDVVKDLAGRHGLSVQMDDSSDKAGEQYVNQQHDLLTDGESEWSVVVAMAEREGKVAYIKGDTLYLTAPDAADGGDLRFTYQAPGSAFASANFVRLTASRNLAVAKDVKVTVNSWDRRKKKVVTSKKDMAAAGDGGDGAAEYNYTVPGLSQDEADAIAEKKLNETTSHEMLISLDELPGDVNADPRQTLILSGTGTAFDQSYQMDSISHRFGFGSGYTMSISAKSKASGRSAK